MPFLVSQDKKDLPVLLTVLSYQGSSMQCLLSLSFGNANMVLQKLVSSTVFVLYEIGILNTI